MNYQETLEWMFSQLPMYQRQGSAALKKDLANTLALAEKLGHPEKRFKSIHVAGTNGKGSVSHMLASILQMSGYKTGLYTSPHLRDFRERIKINGKPIIQNSVIGFIRRNKEFLEEHKLSFFEMTVGMAFDYFAAQNVDIAVIEVGLGGRLDSTNIITPEVSVITNIGYDHMQMLGNTLPEIAFEKAGIIKSGIPVVIGETQPDVAGVFTDVAALREAHVYYADEIERINYLSDLKGNYQKKNIKTVVAVTEILRAKGYKISENQMRQGLQRVIKNTDFKGRWQILVRQPLTLCDTAHNKEGLTYVMQQLSEIPHDKLHMVIGMVNDKDLSRVLPLFPKNAAYYFCRPDIPRGLNAGILQESAKEYGLQGNVYSSVNEALEAATENAAKDDLIFVGGSTFVVAEVV